MLTSIPFISEGSEKSPFSQTASLSEPSTGTIFWAAPSPDGVPGAAHPADHLKPAGQGKLSFPVNSKVVFGVWVLKTNTTHTPAACNPSWSRIYTSRSRGRKGKGKF